MKVKSKRLKKGGYLRSRGDGQKRGPPAGLGGGGLVIQERSLLGESQIRQGNGGGIGGGRALKCVDRWER